MSAKAFDSDSDSAYPKSEGAYRTAGDVIPMKGTMEQTVQDYNATTAIRNALQRGTFRPGSPSAEIIKLPQKPSQ